MMITEDKALFICIEMYTNGKNSHAVSAQNLETFGSRKFIAR